MTRVKGEWMNFFFLSKLLQAVSSGSVLFAKHLFWSTGLKGLSAAKHNDSRQHFEIHISVYMNHWLGRKFR